MLLKGYCQNNNIKNIKSEPKNYCFTEQELRSVFLIYLNYNECKEILNLKDSIISKKDSIIFYSHKNIDILKKQNEILINDIKDNNKLLNESYNNIVDLNKQIQKLEQDNQSLKKLNYFTIGGLSVSIAILVVLLNR